MLNLSDHSASLNDLKRDGLFRAAIGFGATLALAVALSIPLELSGGRLAVQAAAAALLYLGFMGAAWRWLAAHLPHRTLGPANAVTILRAGLAANFGAFLLAPTMTEAQGWVVAALALATLTLDGIDGWTARHFGIASHFGARFDQELDALFTLLLALMIWRLEAAGAWVLIAGLWRYAFLAAVAGLKARHRAWDGALPASRRRRTVCGLSVGALIAALIPPLAGPGSIVLAGSAVAALSISFLLDLRAAFVSARATDTAAGEP